MAFGARLLTIAGAVRDTPVVGRRGRWKILCARGPYPALLRGRSASPLEDDAIPQHFEQSPPRAVGAVVFARRLC